MDAKKFWCNVCKRTVEVVIEEGASAVVAPLIGGTAGSAIGKARGGWEGAIGGALLGLLVGAVAHALIPKAQRIVCTECGGHLA